MEKSKHFENTTILNLLMRVGNTETIHNWYDSKTVVFSCAANWIDYALRKKDTSVGDLFECVFAHIPKDDPRMDLPDPFGKEKGNNLLIFNNTADSTKIIRLMTTILTPVMCFYSFKFSEMVSTIEHSMGDSVYAAFDLESYRKAMGYDAENTSYLFIANPSLFVKELNVYIPKAIREQFAVITAETHNNAYDENNPLFAKEVDYHVHTRNEMFYDRKYYLEELFWKSPEYEYQNEFRFIIPNINFKQIYDPRAPTKYDYSKNQLIIHLPEMQDYSYVVSAREAKTLLFDFTEYDNGYYAPYFLQKPYVEVVEELYRLKLNN